MKRPLLARFGIGRLGSNALASIGGLGVRALLLAVYLVISSRWLGAADYGRFAGLAAAATLLGTLSGWGGTTLLSKNVASNPATLGPAWASILVQIGVSGAGLALVLAALAFMLFGGQVSLYAVVAMAVSELFAFPVVQAATTAFLALQREAASAMGLCLVQAMRLAFLLGAMAFGLPGDVDRIATAHLAGSVAAVLVAVAMVARSGSPPVWRSRWPLVEGLRSGGPYVLATVFSVFYLEIDKVLMLHLAGPDEVGPYTVAFRVAAMFALPVYGLMGAVLPRIFAGDPASKYRTLHISAKVSALYGLAASILLAFIAPWVPMVFGAAFEPAAGHLSLLAVWPLLFSLHHAYAIGLTGMGGQVSRVVIEGVGLAIVVVVNIAFLGRHGAVVAVGALLGAELFMAAGCALAVRRSWPAQETSRA